MKLRTLLMALLLMAGCASALPRRGAQLRMLIEPDTARVYLNERYLGNAKVLAQRPPSVRTGTHFLTVQAPGYFPHDVELTLPAGLTTVRLRLRAIPE